jgi:hypothetical protein
MIGWGWGCPEAHEHSGAGAGRGFDLQYGANQPGALVHTEQAKAAIGALTLARIESDPVVFHDEDD